MRLCLLLLLASLCSLARADGALLIAGGALSDSNQAVWERAVTLAGGRGAAIVIVPTASQHPARSGAAAAARLQSAGARPVVLAPDANADDAALAARVARCGGVWFVGGDQRRITRALIHPDGSPSKLLDAIWAVYHRGGMVAGSSAGAAIMSRTMFSDVPNAFAALRDGVQPGRDLAPGLGFIGPGVFVDQHFLARGRLARLIPAMLASGDKLGIGIDEDTAAVVRDGQLEVVGRSAVLVVDLERATPGREAALHLRDVRLSLLHDGDRYDLRRKQLHPAGPPLNTSDPEFRGPLFSADMLGRQAVSDLMARLAGSDESSARGLAFADDDARGFHFVLRRLPETRAFESSADGSTVDSLALDISPVRMAQPLYVPAD